MKKIKIEKEVTKEDVFVCVANTSEYDEVCRIITAGGEQILKRPFERLVTYSSLEGYWIAVGSMGDKYQITIPQLAELLGVEYPLKPKFEVGKWYKFDEEGCLVFKAGKGGLGYGWWRGRWGRRWAAPDNLVRADGWTETTKEEVKEALVNEANRRYKPGDIITPLKGYYYGSNGNLVLSASDYIYESSNNREVLAIESATRGYYVGVFVNGEWAEVVEEEKRLPTLEELIAEAKSKITKKTREFPCWIEGTREVTSYIVAGTEYMSDKSAIIGYISKRLREEYL